MHFERPEGEIGTREGYQIGREGQDREGPSTFEVDGDQ